MNNYTELTIVLPVHNEEIGIAAVIGKFVKAFKDKKIKYEILCIENGSKDKSLERLIELSKRYKNLKVYKSKKGWGNAVREGIKHAKGKYFCYMVSDDQVDPKYALAVFKAYTKNKFDMVKVKRKNRENLIRYINSKFYNLLSFFIFGIGGDINATPKILQTSLIKKLHLESENIALDLELLLKLKKMRLSWFDLPVVSKNRNHGRSTTNIKSIVEMIQNIIEFRKKL